MNLFIKPVSAVKLDFPIKVLIYMSNLSPNKIKMASVSIAILLYIDFIFDMFN